MYIVYISTTPSIAHQRLTLRARPEEATVTLTYLEQLHRLHELWIERENSSLMDGSSDTNIFVLDGDLPLPDLRERYRSLVQDLRALTF